MLDSTSAPEVTETVVPPADSGESGPVDSGGDTLDAELSAIYAKHNPVRDETGRFRGPPNGEPPQEDASQETEVSPDQPLAAQQEQVKPAIQPPQSWSAEEKAEWEKLPPKAQEAVLRRDKETQQLISRQGTDLKAYEPIRSLIEQNRDVFESSGLPPAEGISRLLAAHRMLEQNPVAAIGQIAQAYGVDLAALAGPAAERGNTSPHEAALHQRIAHLEKMLSETDNRVMRREQQEMAVQQSTLQSLLDKFSKDKADWAELENDVLSELTGINANITAGLIQPMTAEEKLQKAYDRASRNNPEAWERQQAAKRAAEEAKRIEEARRRADDAKRAKAVTGAATPQASRTVRNLDDDLADVWRKHNASS